MSQLNKETLTPSERQRWEKNAEAPVTVLQIGEGNFIRCFVDWMLQISREQGLFEGSVAVTQPRPSGKAKIETLAKQDGLYTLVTRGLEGGSVIERKEIISVMGDVFDPYADWRRFMAYAENPDLRIVVSNTTEAGLVYRPEPLQEGPIASFPGKLTMLLYRRYETFNGAPDKGLLLLPCELLERNGDALREAVLRYAADWTLPLAFQEWVVNHNRFLNSLVDRIVSGYPGDEQAEVWFAEWGYRDALVAVAEPYYLWAIEGEPELDELLPLRKAGLNVHWTDDLRPYQQRKVRILNGSHTWMAALGLLYGLTHVREFSEDAKMGPLLRQAVLQEIVPTLLYPQEEMHTYAESVFERFGNPYLRHALSDIAMNSLSKFKVRLLPSLAYYAERGLPLPEQLVRGLAALLRYCRVERTNEGFQGINLLGETYIVRDDEAALAMIAQVWRDAAAAGEPVDKPLGKLLANDSLWGCDLSALQGLVEAVAGHFREWTLSDRHAVKR